MVSPSVIFIDAIDVIAARKEGVSGRGMDRRIVAQLSDCIDEISDMGAGSVDLTSGSPVRAEAEDFNDSSEATIEQPLKFVILIAATSKPELLDLGVRGRFAKEITLPVPDAAARSQILRLLCKTSTPSRALKTDSRVDFSELGRLTAGFVGADLKTLTREAGMLTVKRAVDSKSPGKTNSVPRESGQKGFPGHFLSEISVLMSDFIEVEFTYVNK